MKLFDLFRKVPTRRTTKRKATSSRRRLRLEACEQRLLMAGDITLVNGVLFIDGTSDNDRAYVAVVGDEVEVRIGQVDAADPEGDLIDEITADFDLADVDSILFWGGPGNDTFENAYFDDDGVLHLNDIPSVAYGHGGYDVLAGGSAND